MTLLPRDPDRERVARALLRSRRVSALLRGREPVRVPALARMIATATGISRGAAESAIRRAAELGEIDLWATVAPAAGESGPDPDRLLDELAEGAAVLERARRDAPGP